MILLIAIVLGVSAFCFYKGFIFVGFLLLIGGFSRTIGFLILGLTSAYLFYKGEIIIGMLPLLLIAVNVIGLIVPNLRKKKKIKFVKFDGDIFKIKETSKEMSGYIWDRDSKNWQSIPVGSAIEAEAKGVEIKDPLLSK